MTTSMEETTPTAEDSVSQPSIPEVATTEPADKSAVSEDQYEMPSDEFEEPSVEESEGDENETEATSDDEEADESANQDDGEKKTPDEIVIDGVKLTPEEAKEALAAYKNRQDWQRSFTKRDQEFRAEQKEWQANIERQIAQGLSKTKTDEELAAMTPEERQTEKWLKERGYISRTEVDGLIKQAISPFVKDIESIRQNEGSRQILSEAEKLMTEYGLSEDEVMDVARFAQSNQMMHRPLKDSYILMNKDNIVAAQLKAKEEQTKRIAAKKKAASQSIKPNGSDGVEKSDGLDYDPKKHGKMSYRDLARLM